MSRHPDHDHDHDHGHHDHDRLHPRFRPVNRAYLAGDVPVLGPVGIAVHGIGHKAKHAIGFDAVRHGILFHNPNAHTVLRVLPEGEHLRAGEGGIVIPPFGFFEQYDSAGGNLGEDWSRVRINTAWQVVADEPHERHRHHDGYGLTIWDFTDSRGPVTMPTANLLIDVQIHSPNGWQFRLRCESKRILNRRLNRRGILFHNPGCEPVAVAPENIEASIGAGSIVLPPHAQKELRAFGKIRVNAAFNAASAHGHDGEFTALEYV